MNSISRYLAVFFALLACIFLGLSAASRRHATRAEDAAPESELSLPQWPYCSWWFELERGNLISLCCNQIQCCPMGAGHPEGDL